MRAQVHIHLHKHLEDEDRKLANDHQARHQEELRHGEVHLDLRTLLLWEVFLFLIAHLRAALLVDGDEPAVLSEEAVALLHLDVLRDAREAACLFLAPNRLPAPVGEVGEELGARGLLLLEILHIPDVREHGIPALPALHVDSRPRGHNEAVDEFRPS